MSAPEGRPDRAIAERLATALERALGGAPARAPLEAARDAARVIGLEGLGRVLAALVPLGGRRWTAEALAVCERLRALARTARVTGSLEPLRRAEPDMEVIAARLGAAAGAAGDHAPGGSLSLAEAVGPMRGEEDLMARAHDVRLTTPVAAALRAALDWLAGDRRPLRFAVDDSALEIVLDRVNFAGLEAADRVLRDVGGNIGPALEGGTPTGQPRPWIMRLPTVVPRPSFLMVMQGGLRLAIPWQAVLRLRMAPAGSLEGRDRVLGLPVVAPLAKPIGDAPQRPAVVVASGWKRACFIADRLVWRMIADPIEAGMAPTPGITGAVRTEDGDIFWVVDTAELLVPVEAPAPIEPPAPAGPPAPPGEPAGSAPSARHEGRAAPEAATPLEELEPGDVEPLDDTETLGPERTTAPAPAAPGGEAAGRTDAPAGTSRPSEGAEEIERTKVPRRHGPATARGRALIAEDSIAARIFLTRMLEQEGFEVQAVSTAADLFNVLDGRHRLVFVDVELPDGSGSDLLLRVVAGAGITASVVGLVRDADDRSVATAAGIAHTLRKPFEREELARLLTALGIVRENG